MQPAVAQREISLETRATMVGTRTTNWQPLLSVPGPIVLHFILSKSRRAATSHAIQIGSRVEERKAWRARTLLPGAWPPLHKSSPKSRLGRGLAWRTELSVSRERASHLSLTTLGISDAGNPHSTPFAHEAPRPGFPDVAIVSRCLHPVHDVSCPCLPRTTWFGEFRPSARDRRH